MTSLHWSVEPEKASIGSAPVFKNRLTCDRKRSNRSHVIAVTNLRLALLALRLSRAAIWVW